MVKENSIGREADYKGITALGVVAKVTSLFKQRKSAFEAVIKPLTGRENVEWKASFCSGCHQPTCATQVKVVDGVVVEVCGDPKSSTNRGALCPRGLALPLLA